ncbi:MAG: DUF1836 domain-containing protein [Clostridia bacterium]|nr:DUF1836 domain-containing protein [Clostridia bacterium]
MSTTYPGTTIETTALTKGSSRMLFEGIFATGGITLSQVSVMTDLEPYIIQNWVKRGFVSPPQKRVYSREQFARIVIINMLRESLQIERICGLIRVIGGVLDDPLDDLISDDELYHRYVDMVAEDSIRISDPSSVMVAATGACADFEERVPGAGKKLVRILQVMLYAHSAARLRKSAEEILSAL